MSGRRINVDLGPLTLSLLEGNLPQLAHPAACRDDIQKLQSMMRRSTGAKDDVADRIEADETTVDCRSAKSVPCAQDLHGLHNLDDAHVELLAFELSAALQVAESKRTARSSEIRLVLRPAVLREAELSVIESEAALEFSLWIGNEDDCRWLAEQLPRLARTLGEKLRRRFRLRLFDGFRQLLLAEQTWPPGAYA